MKKTLDNRKCQLLAFCCAMTQDWKEQRQEQTEHSQECPVSLVNIQRLAIRALELGNVDIPGHFKRRCAERNCSTLDVERVIRKGTICQKPKFNPDFENWRFTMRARCDGRSIDVRLALDLRVECESPLLVFITVTKGGSDDNGDDGGEKD